MPYYTEARNPGKTDWYKDPETYRDLREVRKRFEKLTTSPLYFKWGGSIRIIHEKRDGTVEVVE